MTNYLKVALCALVMLFSLNAFAQGNLYYWSSNKKISLNEDRTSMVVHFNNPAAATKAMSNFSHPFVKETEIHSIQGRAILKFDGSMTADPMALLKEIGIATEEVRSATFGWMLDDGFQLWPTHHVVTQLGKGVSLSDVTPIFAKYGAKYSRTDFSTLVIEVQDVDKALSLANALKESGKVQWSHPDFYATVTMHANIQDPYFQYQFQMHNTGQTVSGYAGQNDIDADAYEAWDIVKGNGIKVAVIDDGVEAHEDLRDANGNSRIIAGYTPANNGNGTPGSDGAHGVACAGIIAASHNNIGIAGAAPECDLLTVNIFAGGESTQDLANAITWSKNQGADVLSNSWGYSSCSMSASNLESALTDAKNNGRGGKGCIIVFASGNDYGSCVSFPGNYVDVIAVGSVTNQGNHSNYSNKGAALDLCAPSNNVGGPGAGVYTIDREGSAGYASGNYTASFGGTSAACPVVAGVAALLLSADPNLTSDQATTILYNTATDMGSAGRDNTYGHGRVSAYDAIQEALGGTNPNPNPDPECYETSVSLSLTTDNYGSETTWTLKDASGATVESGSGYANNTTYNLSWTLAAGDYTFTINDSYGDGICCSYGNGSYSLTSGGASIKAGGSFGSTESTAFCVEGGGSTPTPDPNCHADVDLRLVTDRYGSETTWTLKNAAGTTVESGSGYANNTTYNINWSLSDGSYTFTINDSYGDGICCSYGNGSYTLTGNSGATIATGGDFGSTESFEFCVSGASVSFGTFNTASTSVLAVEENAMGNWKLYPNPVQNTLSVEINVEGAVMGQVVNAVGQIVVETALLDGNNNIDVSKLPAGMYQFSVVESTGKRMTQKFVKMK